MKFLKQLQRVEAVWTCLDVLCPDMVLKAKKVLAEKGVGLVPWGGSETAPDNDHLGAGLKHYLVDYAVH